jgi:hypothetical protein
MVHVEALVPECSTRATVVHDRAVVDGRTFPICERGRTLRSTHRS